MIVERPLEIDYVPPFLRTMFTGKLAEAQSGTVDERETNFLTRALAALALHKLVPCTVDESVASIVDGGGDGGIDAIYYSSTTHFLWVIQSKFHRDGRGEPDLGSVVKFKTGLESLLRGEFEAFHANAALTAMIPALKKVFQDGLLQVRAALVYTGIHLVSDDRVRAFEDLKHRFSADSDYLQVRFCNLTTVYDWMIDAHLAPGVPEVEFTLLKPGWVKEPYETVFGLLPLPELARLHKDYGKGLITANIRGYKGNTEVNEQIVNTVTTEPEHFFYLNNGLTAYCERLQVNNLDRADAEKKRITAFGISIVNGAQTLGSVATFAADAGDAAIPGHVFMKVISLERCADDREFAKRITRSTNFQNQIGSRDFVALDELQEHIANQLVMSGVNYHYKDSEDTPAAGPNDFTMEEATTACASLIQATDGDFCSRILANRKSLWSFEEVYPATEMYRSRYQRVFRPDRSARTIWRSVQTKRLVLDVLKTTETGVRKQFFENCRWLILNVVFLKLHPQDGEALSLSAQEIGDITTAALGYAEQLWTVCLGKGLVSPNPNGGWDSTRHFRSVFSSAADCALLRGSLLAALAATPAAVPSPAPPAAGAI
jgi:hypothetical protein